MNKIITIITYFLFASCSLINQNISNFQLHSTLNTHLSDAIFQLGDTNHMMKFQSTINLSETHIVQMANYLSSNSYKTIFVYSIHENIDGSKSDTINTSKFIQKSDLQKIQTFILITSSGDVIEDLDGFNTIYSQANIKYERWIPTALDGTDTWEIYDYQPPNIRYLLVKELDNKLYHIFVQKSSLNNNNNNNNTYQLLNDDTFQEAQKYALLYTKE